MKFGALVLAQQEQCPGLPLLNYQWLKEFIRNYDGHPALSQ